MTEKSTGESFFQAQASIYGDNVFAKNAIQEVDIYENSYLG